MAMNRKQEYVIIELSDKEHSLIEYLRQVPYGEVVIIMHNRQPVRIERTKEVVQL